MTINSIIEKMEKDAENFCRNCCPYYPSCIYPACERVEYDSNGTHVVYKLDPFGVSKNESLQ